MERVLVTGATGFIGLELSIQLKNKGIRPYLLVRRPLRAPILASLDAHIVQGDLSSPESLQRACKGMDTIIHLGARAIFEEYDRVKPTIVDGSLNLMQAAKDAGVKNFIYSSSLLVYDSQQNPIDRDTPAHPKCGYGIAKVEAENRLRTMAQECGMKLAIIRLPHVYGARDLLFHEVRKGKVYYPGNGKNIFAHMHVFDAARILISAAENEWQGTSAVGDDLSVNWIDFFAEIKKYYPRLRTYSVPEWFALLYTYIIYPFRRMRSTPSVNTPGSVISWNLSLPVKKGLLWDELGIQPTYPTIFEGIPSVLDDCIPFLWIHPSKDFEA